MAVAIVARGDPGAWSLRQMVSVTMSQHVDARRYLGTKGGCGLAEQQCRVIHGGSQNEKSISERQIAAQADMAVSFVHVR